MGLYWGTALQMWQQAYNSVMMSAYILSTHESASETDSGKKTPCLAKAIATWRIPISMSAFTGPSSQTERGGFDAPYMHPTMLQCYRMLQCYSYGSQDIQLQLATLLARLKYCNIRACVSLCLSLRLYQCLAQPWPIVWPGMHRHSLGDVRLGYIAQDEPHSFYLAEKVTDGQASFI